MKLVYLRWLSEYSLVSCFSSYLILLSSDSPIGTPYQSISEEDPRTESVPLIPNDLQTPTVMNMKTDWYWFIEKLTDGVGEWWTGWLSDWLTVQVTDHWLTLSDRVTDWLTEPLTDLPTNWLTVWQNNWLTYQLTDWLNHWLTYQLTDRATDWLTNWLTKPLTDLPNDWLTEPLSDLPTDWRSNLASYWVTNYWWLTSDWLITKRYKVWYNGSHFSLWLHGLSVLSSA